MLRNKSILLTVYGILLASAVTGALKGGRSKLKIATTSTTTTELPENESSDEDGISDIEGSTPANEVNATTKRTLTGIPQIDYIWDPNLPRELNGYNLSEYPFYDRIPPDLNFNCDGLHDGFYASVVHKCQVYHHCLFGTRFDFLCANFTAFDQKTFICHFASEVDCANSKKYWHRNDALYQAASTSTPAPTTTTPRPTTTTPAAATTTAAANQVGSMEGQRPYRRRRPLRRRPAYDYYEEEYYDDEYDHPRVRGGYDRRENYDYDDRGYMKRERDRDRGRDRDRDRERDRNHRDRDLPRREPARDDRDPIISRDRLPNRNNRKEPIGAGRPVEDTRPVQLETSGRNEKGNDYDEEPPPTANSDTLIKPAAPSSSVYARPRTPPKIRRPVPLTEQDRFAYKTASSPVTDTRKVTTQSHPSAPAVADDYIEDKFEDTHARRPMRQRRPFRDHERSHYDQMRPSRDRERDQHFRSRFKEEKDDNRPVKMQPERWRDQQYARGNKDESLDYNYDNEPLTSPPPSPSLMQSRFNTSTEKNHDNKDEKAAEPINCVPAEITSNSSHITDKSQRFQSLESSKRASNKTPEQKCLSNNENNSKSDEKKNQNDNVDNEKNQKESSQSSKFEEPISEQADANDDEYEDEEYDKSQQDVPSTLPPFRAGVRVVKRPFLPSRGGHQSPRGLYLVGARAKQDQSLPSVGKEEKEPKSSPDFPAADNEKHVNDAYEIIRPQITEMEPARRPSQPQLDTQKPRIPSYSPAPQQNHEKSERPPVIHWNTPGDSQREIGQVNGKQRVVNEVVTPYRILDIPESEYDVSLNEALTPPFNHDSSLPTGFLLPTHHHHHQQHHQKSKQEPVRESSDNSYTLFHDDKREQKPFSPSLQMIPLTRIGNNNNQERFSRVQFGGQQSRAETHFVQPSRATWNSYN